MLFMLLFDCLVGDNYLSFLSTKYKFSFTNIAAIYKG